MLFLFYSGSFVIVVAFLESSLRVLSFAPLHYMSIFEYCFTLTNYHMAYLVPNGI